MGQSGVAAETNENRRTVRRNMRGDKALPVWKWLVMLMFTWIPILGAIILTMVMVRTEKPDVKRFCIANLILQTAIVILMVIAAARMSGFIMDLLSQ